MNTTETIAQNQLPIRVLIVDDYYMVRQGLIALLNIFDEFEVVADAKDAQAGVILAQCLKPDVVLMDIVMPGMDGVEATRLIRESCPDTQVIVLTSFSDDQTIKNAIKAGAISFLMKNVSVDGLAQAVRKAHQGQSTFAPEAARALLAATRHPAEMAMT
jgi:two-component system, NarL family, response regulator LiaR